MTVPPTIFRRDFFWRDLGVACALALAMSAAWSFARWGELAALVLPDTDDVMRLQQIRDWLAGQQFADLTQHRLGIDGVAMHWSRLPDIIPAAIIALVRPFADTATAEVTAVVLWPALLFVALLMLVARIARTLDAAPLDAMLVALLAYPATTLFAPGRIDHHGLQLVLLLGCCLGLVGRSTLTNGVASSLCAVAGVAIGMETVPLLAAAIGAALIRWTTDQGEDRRVTGLAIGLGIGTVASLLLATDSWRFAGCDGFDRRSWTAAMIAAVGIGLLVITGRRLAVSGRIVALALVALGALVAIAIVSPECLFPYASVDPRLARSWLADVGEAQGLFAADPRWAIAYAGLLVVAIACALKIEPSDPRPERRLLLGVAIASLALAVFQIRGAYGGVAVAIPLLAEVIARARRHGSIAALGARILTAGIIYPAAAAALPVAGATLSVAGASVPAPCDTRAARAMLRHLPRARVLAPIDMGPWLISATPHHALAGPYHRNTAGNLAVERFANASANERAHIAGSLRIDYWVGCRPLAGLVPTGTPALWRTR